MKRSERLCKSGPKASRKMAEKHSRAAVRGVPAAPAVRPVLGYRLSPAGGAFVANSAQSSISSGPEAPAGEGTADRTPTWPLWRPGPAAGSLTETPRLRARSFAQSGQKASWADRPEQTGLRTGDVCSGGHVRSRGAANPGVSPPANLPAGRFTPGWRCQSDSITAGPRWLLSAQRSRVGEQTEVRTDVPVLASGRRL